MHISVEAISFNFLLTTVNYIFIFIRIVVETSVLEFDYFTPPPILLQMEKMKHVFF